MPGSSVVLIGRMTGQDDGALALETRQRRTVPNEFRMREAPPEKLAAGDRFCQEAHPHARLVCSSALYNCGGLVFGSRRVWIEPDQFRRILTDDGYRPVTDSPRPGDLVLYGKSLEGVDHIGVVHHTCLANLPERPEPEVWVRSKWGDCGEYVHEIRDVPVQCGQPLQTLRFR